MKIEITGRHVEITAELREFTEEKVGKLERVLEGPAEAHVVLAVSKHRHSAEIRITSKSLALSGTVETSDFHASIGEVVDKLERQARKHKEKLHDHKHRKGPRDPDIAAAIGANVTAAVASAPVEDTALPRVVRSERYRLKPMSAEDAVLELEETAEDLLVFREAETLRINVVYRQKDGTFGLIDPDF